MPVAAVLFDNDGLLLDTEHLWTLAETELFERHGVVFTPEHKRELLGTSGDRTAAILARLLGQPERGHELAREMGEILFAQAEHPAHPMPGALALLDTVEAAGLRRGLASNSPRTFVDRVVDAAGIRDRFDAILTVDDVARPKPAPDLYLALAAALGADPGDCVALEDSPTGVAAARAAGVYTIGVPSLPGVALGEADLVCDSLSDPRVARTLTG